MEPLWSPVVATGGNQRQIGCARKRQEQAKTVAVGCDRLRAKFHGKQGVCRGLPPVAGGPLPEKEGVDPRPVERWIQAGANSGHSLLHNHARSATRARVYQQSIPDSASRSAPATRMARSPEERRPTGQQGSGVLAVRLHDDGLKVEEIETPSPDPGEVLARVHAAAITRGELEWPVDRLPAIPSYELSGVVGGRGDEVYALTPVDRNGVAAEYAVVPADVLAPRPLRLSHVEAAALPMGGLTAWQALFVHGRLARGERVLVTGASGGVGHIAVQLARHAGAAVVESGPAGLVFDTRGGEVPAGERVVTIAEEMPGAIYFIVEPDHEQLLELGTLVDAGELRAEVDSVFPLTEARAAFERVAARGKRGKVVLEVGTD